MGLSWTHSQLLRIKQQKMRVASILTAAVVADDDDALPAVDHGGADAFGMFEPRQAGNAGAAGRVIWAPVPEPEQELNIVACDGSADEQVAVERGQVAHAAYAVAAVASHAAPRVGRVAWRWPLTS